MVGQEDAHVQPRRRGADRAASLVEYALLVALIAMVCFAAVVFFGDSTSTKFSNVSSEINEATSD